MDSASPARNQCGAGAWILRFSLPSSFSSHHCHSPFNTAWAPSGFWDKIQSRTMRQSGDFLQSQRAILRKPWICGALVILFIYVLLRFSFSLEKMYQVALNMGNVRRLLLSAPERAAGTTGTCWESRDPNWVKIWFSLTDTQVGTGCPGQDILATKRPASKYSCQDLLS